MTEVMATPTLTVPVNSASYWQPLYAAEEDPADVVGHRRLHAVWRAASRWPRFRNTSAKSS
jgi:hypothetical protein